MKTSFLKFVCLVLLTTLAGSQQLQAGEPTAPTQSRYTPRGIGGGGAMASFSISPYAKLRFVGTDMGTLFRSTDDGKSWQPIDHRQATFSSDLAHSAALGFSADGKTVFHASAGRDPRRSEDAGVTWQPIKIGLATEERIKYWVSDYLNPGILLCGTSEGLWRTINKGETWTRIPGVSGTSMGTVILHQDGKPVTYHATESAIHVSRGMNQPFEKWYSPPGTGIHGFAGGANEHGTTLAFIDTQGAKACSWSHGDATTVADCGFVWIAEMGEGLTPDFHRTSQEAGRFVRMAENDPLTIYVTGGNWVRQYGSKVWVSKDRGRTWKLKFHQYDWDQRPYRSWPKDKLEYSAIGLDVGWDDNAYTSFAVNSTNSSEAGGTGYYFLHTSSDQGDTWKAPFTQFADKGARGKGKKWASTGLEVTSVLRLKFHPRNPRLAYAALSDLGGLVTEDGGDTWRICKAQQNTNYDYAFDPAQPNWVYAATGALHDFPLNQNAPINGQGGIYLSKDRGLNWKRLTPENKEWDRQFLSVAYDSIHNTLYAGTQGGGIASSSDSGKHWIWLRTGLPLGPSIIPQIEIDPENGDVYALLTGNAPDFKNSRFTGIYKLSAGTKPTSWTLLRGKVQRPKEVDAKYDTWLFPTAFAIDFSHPNREVLYLADMESKGAWLASGIWKTTDHGAHWSRTTQFTHPTALTIDPKDSRRIYASGPHVVNGAWGQGGALFSTDSGETWSKNEQLPLVANLDGTVPDPASAGNVFYLFFGGGMLYGPKP